MDFITHLDLYMIWHFWHIILIYDNLFSLKSLKNHSDSGDDTGMNIIADPNIAYSLVRNKSHLLVGPSALY